MASIATLHTAVPAMGSSTMRSLDWVVSLVKVLEDREVEQAEICALVPYASVVFWARQRTSTIGWKDVSERFGVCRATAYRWLPAIRRLKRKDGQA
jgi:hypothetical protein